MQLMIEPAGNIRCVYGEDLDLARLGEVQIRRASHVEPDGVGALVGGPVAGWGAEARAVSGCAVWPSQRRRLGWIRPSARRWYANGDRCSDRFDRAVGVRRLPG